MPAKAGLKNLEAEWKPRVGQVFARSIALANLSQKEAAALLGRDQAQVNRWCVGSEPVPLYAVCAVDALRQPFWLALANVADVDVTTQLTLRVRA